jgi:transposase-like protein
MVERETNTLILYPVSDRSEDTLLPIIQRHVEPGTIYSSYCRLNELGYRHFTVLHKYSFKNTTTGEEVEIHTNRIEGAWKHAKDHFRRLSGTKISPFEGHLCEIMWRAEVTENIYDRFIRYLQSVYNLSGPPKYTYPTPVFSTWPGLDGTASMVEEWEVNQVI